MLEFAPWSKKVLESNVEYQKKGYMPVLDLELSAQCTGACCVYCDSKPNVGCAHAGEIDWPALLEVMKQSTELGLKWVYTCGLGEPMEDGKFWDLIDFLKFHNIHLSMFTNGLFIKDNYIAKELKSAGVNIILKMDTFDEKKYERILNKKGAARRIYEANEYLLNAGYGSKDGKYTDLAYSIVPTIFSYDGIPEVIDFAEKNGIFPSIGELENAGNVYRKGIKDVLDVNSEDLLNLKKLADNYSNGDYKRPICSAILTGIHIDNMGDCIVDRTSGLNCKWFLLTEPDVYKIGNIRNISVKHLFDKVNEYRKQQFTKNNNLFKKYIEEEVVFGGCGGNIKEVFKLAIELNG